MLFDFTSDLNLFKVISLLILDVRWFQARAARTSKELVARVDVAQGTTMEEPCLKLYKSGFIMNEYYTTLHYTTLHYTTLHYIILFYFILYYFIFYFIIVYYLITKVM